MEKKIGVLIVDDSAVVRQTISGLLSDERDIEVIATASDPYCAAEKIAEKVPDVIILDIEMPRMDGLTFLQKIMTQHPIPVIICSSLADDGSDSAVKALSSGAVDIITKPKMGTRQFLEESRIRITDTIRAASSARLKKMNPAMAIEATPKYTADVIMPKVKKSVLTETTDKVVVVGASTGGTEALREFLIDLPLDTAGVVIVQHMPENFTRAFAERLDSLCSISVKEAKNGDTVLRGQALIAPGNMHTLLKRSGAQYYVEVKDGPLVTRHRPSVDVLFRSTAYYAGKNAIGVIMTGMGDDGSKGMKEMKEAGAYNIAQDEESCVVFGMPKEAIKLNAIDKVLPLSQIAKAVYSASKV
ncbi:MAG TPA: chemotaxis response regulator protein-glutamate methylesterase [Spirochaetota bacterium]|nr:chemotaxis response regulator protein-glutamate methylesterase [Spirochaetota bacterium]HPF05107.1 chemotaxis response regulator protein-glutamate methylesterase [Spirochaetota bacterium]HPJ41512.1 chemotaxis response regulator protein-glutamate methylesterase [Spirochaetota bacterium]HPR37707.1 chemotaxis response regulator protein-glutamate methylesterase [Spirochaetota bacterium]HRX46556.1 chemotaxis response regulator protein-glutamate methylesterase [Spirochaetota bacterium]